jgi:serine phosphatase RsbU (regulator of sigma subunit)
VIFSGAKHSLYIIRDFNFIEIKGDKYPIGSFLDEDLKQFTNHEFQIEKGDQIYLFTDGYSDQFGGPLGKKFRPQNLKALLISISHLNLEEQKRLILENFNKWKGDLEQVDDVCMFSTKF